MINLEAKILDKKGKVAIINIKTTEKKKGKDIETLKVEDLTIKRMVENVLLDKGEDTDPKSLYKRYNLWLKIKDSNKTTKEEETLIKKLCAEKLDILVVGQIFNAIK